MKTAAILTLNDADKYTENGKSLIAKWLRDQADFIESEEVRLKGFAKRFRARYIYE